MMADLKGKVQNALDEARILVLGTQVLIGFQYQAVFYKSFEKLPEAAQTSKLVGLLLLLVAFTLLTLPVTYHRIVERGEDTDRFHRVVTRAIFPALAFFGGGLAMDFLVAGWQMKGRPFGVALGLVSLAVALTLWYAIGMAKRPRRIRELGGKDTMKGEGDPQPFPGTKLQDRVKQALTEARVVLPGAQALLGFQFAAFLTEPFEKLPETSKMVHLVSLGLIALCTILLMTPAAWHRIVEQGEDSEEFHALASRFVLAAMVPLALGLSGDLYVVAAKVLKSPEAGTAVAGVMLLFFLGAWFGYTLYHRGRREKELREVVPARVGKVA